MLGPVFRYEMLAAGRRPRYVWFRVLIGLGMLLLLAVGYQTVTAEAFYRGESGDLSIAETSWLSTVFFQQFAWATLFGVLAVTPAVAAGAIASERERRTIEHLFATDLSNREIVLDKLAARLLTVAALVLATLPVLAIFRFLGGVPGDVLIRHFVVLAAAALLTAAIAITRGVWCERAREAVPAALSAVFLWLIAWPLVEFLVVLTTAASTEWAFTLGHYVLGPLAVALREIHPVAVLLASTGLTQSALGIDVDGWTFARMIGCQVVVAVVLLAIAVANVRRVHLSAASTPAKAKPNAGGGKQKRVPYEHRPMLWKEMFASSVPRRGKKVWRRAAVVIFTLAVASPPVTVLSIAIYTGSGDRGFNEYMQMATGMSSICGTILLLMLGNRAAGLVSHEHERDTWLSLLTTPLTGDEILDAKAWGNLYAFRWPIAGVAAIPALGVVLDPRALLSAFGVLLVLLVLAAAATWIGLTVSLRVKTSVKAVGVASFAMIAIGGLYSGIAGTFFGLAGVGPDVFPVLVLPPLVPMLLAAPSVLAFENSDGSILVAVALGVMLYVALGFALRLGAITSFDRLCERGPAEPELVTGTAASTKSKAA